MYYYYYAESMMNKALEASVKANEGSNESEEYFKAYVNEWESLFVGDDYLQQIKSKAVKGDLKACNFRSICWKLLLGCLPEDSNLWIESTKSQRQYYEEILDKISYDPRYTAFKDDVTINNPLSLSEENPWNQYFKDKELKKTIQQDVIRTFPEIKFFQCKEVQKLMISILFAYAQQFPHLSYKQGMHELLAPIIYVLTNDINQYVVAAETGNLNMQINVLLNRNYLEHDAFSLFSKLMEAVQPWYSTNISPNSKMPYFDQRNQLAVKLKGINENLLKKFDFSLYEYLGNMEIIPQVYGIRWLRLLFGREFPIEDLLGLWDAIFASNKAFELVDYICVAMLISMRQLLLSADYSTCLRYLMRYPNSIQLRSVINLAFRLRKLDLDDKKESVPYKAENFILPGVLKDVKQNVNKAVSKNASPGITRPIKVLSNVKYSENRPKSLSLASSFWGHSSNAVSEGLNKEKYQSSDQSSFEFIEETDYLTTKKPNTLPRARIQNIMEKKTSIIDSSDACSAIENLADRTMLDKRPLAAARTQNASCKEMVPLSLSLPSQSAENQTMDAMRFEVEDLRSKISDLRVLNEYCSKQLSQHIERLQSFLIEKNLMDEDDVINSLSGLKRVQDSLKGTSEFLEEDSNCDSICTSVYYSECNQSQENKTKSELEKAESCKVSFHHSSKSSIHKTLSRKLKENLKS